MTSKPIYSTAPAKGWLPWGAFAPFLCVLFNAATVLGISPLMEYFHFQDAMGEPIGLTGLYAFLLIPFALLGLTIVVWVRVVERRAMATIGLVGSGGPRRFLGGLLVGAATLFVVVAAIWIAGGFQADGFGRALGSPRALAGIGILLACFAVQASVEEIVFRGWLLSLIVRKFNVPVAVLLTSLAFTFLHYSPHQHWLIVMSSFLFSAFACVWALKADNIWGVMGWHTGWNWLLATGFELPVTGIKVDLPALLVRLTVHGPDTLTGGARGPEGSFLCSAFFVVAIAFLLLRPKAVKATVESDS